ncbi:MAG: hypothetical protein KF858_01545 [Candidatus Sumerlaeia bacterium]|nr:hypothetical protein [Candidatus Sumerlaeia bacterium]
MRVEFVGDMIAVAPRASAVLHGLTAAAGLLVAWGLLGSVVPALLVPVLVWAALAYRRPLAYQVILLVIICLIADVGSGRLLGASLPAGAAALLVGGLMPRPADESRWAPGHALFALLAVTVWWGATGLAGWLRPALVGPPAGVLSLVASWGLIAVAAAVVAAGRMVQAVRAGQRREPTLAGRWRA